MASETKAKVVGIFYICLLLSVDPIQASRVKSSKHLHTKMQESQELATELQKALNENHMEELFVHNATSLYIGESWANCAQRKTDFEQRSKQVQKLYDEAQEDDTLTTIESGWIILQARKVAMTVSNAEKQGCEWVHNQDVDMTHLKGLLNKTAVAVPCREAAKVSLESVKGEPTEEDVAKALSILFSRNCKPRNTEGQSAEQSEGLKEVFAAEEKEEEDTAKVVAEFKANRGAEGITSLLQQVSDQIASEGVVIILSGVLSMIMGFILALLVCVVSLAVLALVLGVVYCLMRVIIAELLQRLDYHELVDSFPNCADRWIRWLKTAKQERETIALVGGTYCLASTVLGFAGTNQFHAAGIHMYW